MFKLNINRMIVSLIILCLFIPNIIAFAEDNYVNGEPVPTLTPGNNDWVQTDKFINPIIQFCSNTQMVGSAYKDIDTLYKMNWSYSLPKINDYEKEFFNSRFQSLKRHTKTSERCKITGLGNNLVRIIACPQHDDLYYMSAYDYSTFEATYKLLNGSQQVTTSSGATETYTVSDLTMPSVPNGIIVESTKIVTDIDKIDTFSSFNTSSFKTETKVSNSSAYRTSLKKEYCKKIVEVADKDWAGSDNVIGPIKMEVFVTYADGVTGTETVDSFLGDINMELLDRPTKNSDLVKISYNIDGTDYVLYSPTTKTIATNSAGETVAVDRKILATGNFSNKEAYLNMSNCAENTKVFLKGLQDAVNFGIIGGSVGTGYNVAGPYSKNQVPLEDVMELTYGTPSLLSSSEDSGDSGDTDENEGNDSTANKNSGYAHYDFKSEADVEFAFSEYYSPLFGKIVAAQVPKTEEEWIAYADAHKGYINGSAIVKHSDFDSFRKQASTGVGGYFLSDTKKIKNGVKKFPLDGSTDPKSVLSYNVTLYTPYAFSLSGSSGRMLMSFLRPIDGYTFCLYDNNIYKNEDMTTSLVGMNTVGVPRTSLYLYNQDVVKKDENGNDTTVKTGVVIVGIYEECVVDETEGSKHGSGEHSNVITDFNKAVPHLYLTGRKIGFDGGYSDTINFDKKNVNTMYATSKNSGKIGIMPKSFAFPLATKDIEIRNIYNAISFRAEEDNKEEVQKVKDLLKPKTTDETIGYAFNVNNHADIPDGGKGVILLCGFGGFLKEDDESLNENSNSSTPTSNSGENGENGESGENKKEDNLYYTFYILRNNKHITTDEELLNWLRSDEAASLSQVREEELIAKITGDFTKQLDILQYSDWKRMQEIRSELDYDKSMGLVRVMNVTAIVMGVFLIAFAILFMLAYWIDIFNTLTEFSILNTISFGNLFPVADKDSIAYLRERKGNTKFVTFKDVLIIALIMIGIGVLFFSFEKVIFLFATIYNYIMDTIGGR